MKRIDITKQDDGYKVEIRENHTEDVIASREGLDTMVDAMEAIDALNIKDSYYVVAAEDKQAGEDAVTALARDESVRTANYESSEGWNVASDDADDTDDSQGRIETLG